MKLILVRHGQSEAQVGRDSDDPRLTECGREQARLLGEYLRTVKIDRIYASHLTRAVETAAAVARAQDRDLPITVLPQLAERGTRPDWVQSADVLRAVYPHLSIEGLTIGPGYANDEERADAALQICAYAPAYESGFTRREQSDGHETCENELTVLVAAHAMYNGLLISRLTDLPLRREIIVSQYNACINRFTFFVEDGVRRTRFLSMNETPHLPPDLLT